MKTRSATVNLGLLIAVSACNHVLGVDDGSERVECNSKQSCDDDQRCEYGKCVPKAASAGTGNPSTGAAAGAPTSGGTTAWAGAFGDAGNAPLQAALTQGGSSFGSVAGGTGPVANTIGGGAVANGGVPSSSVGSSSASDVLATGGTSGVGNIPSGGAGEVTNKGGAIANGGIAGEGTSIGGKSAGSAGTVNGGTTTGGAGGNPTAGCAGAGGTSGAGGQGAGGQGAGGQGAGGQGAGGQGAGGQGAGGNCEAGTHRCVTYEVEGHPVYWQSCSNGHWELGTICPDYCSTERGCAEAPSCVGMNRCSSHTSCCSSTPLPGGAFTRSPLEGVVRCSATARCPASVSPFSLDVFEVTVGRFRKFVAEYPNSLPRNGSGKNRSIPSDLGWSETWRQLLPLDQAQLVQVLTGCSESTYTEKQLTNEFLPVGCVSWYLAFAFCIWDGGRLPTELEWDYAASGGEDRYYPWSVPPGNTFISAEHAIYTPLGDYPGLSWPKEVGKTPKGVARWGHYDLAGNMLEWLADAYGQLYLDTTSCNDCADLDWTNPQRVTRGGAYLSDEAAVTAATRMSAGANEPLPWLGFRCARDL